MPKRPRMSLSWRYLIARGLFQLPRTASIEASSCARASWGKLLPACWYDLLVRGHYVLEALDVQFGVQPGPAAILDGLEGVLEVVVLDAQHHVAEHLHEAAVGVPGEPLVAGQAGEGLEGLIVQPQVQHGVHHAGHGGGRPAADRDQQRIGPVAEGLAGELLQPLDVGGDFLRQAPRPLAIELVEQIARHGGDGEAWGDGQAQGAHLREVSALASQQGLHGSLALGLAAAEEIHVLSLLGHRISLR